jgi:membrane fusion protein, multidrug efflux system
MKKRQYIIVGSLAFILVGSFMLMQFLTAQKKDIPRRAPELGERWVAAEIVEYSTVRTTVVTSGRVVSTAEVEVISEATGKIESGSVPLKKGQAFSTGDTLLTIYKDEAELALMASKSQFLNRIANLLPDIKVDFPEDYNEFSSFFNSINLNNEFLPLPEIKSEKMKIFLSSRNVLNDYYSVKKGEKQLQRHTIIAPFQGTYTNVNMQVGAFTNMGGRIGSIIRTDVLEVEAPVENAQARFIKVGDPAKVTSPQRELRWDGTVVRVSEVVDINTQSRSIFSKVPLKNNARLYAGEYLNVELSGGVIADAMQVPRSAVFNSNEAFVVIDGKLQKRLVDVLKRNEKSVVIRGLDKGIYVVTQPLINVAENTDVKILGVDKPTTPEKGRAGQETAAR